MQATRTTLLAFVAILVTSVSPAQEPSSTLPSDGAWARYHAVSKSDDGTEGSWKSTLKFLGRVDKRGLVDCYRASDFMVLPSISVESQPIVILEAMATGLPIITTDLPGPSELVEEGMNGYVTKSGSAKGLETAIRSLTREDLASKSRNSRLLAEQKHSYERVIGAYLDEYSALLE